MITELALIEMWLLMIFTIVLLWWYRSPELTPPFLTVIIGVAWFMGFVGTLLLPLDIAQGIYYGPSTSILLVWYVLDHTCVFPPPFFCSCHLLPFVPECNSSF